MTKILANTDFALHIADFENSLLEQHWPNKEERMTEDDYKEEMKNYLKFVTTYKFRRALINTRDFNFIIKPDVQQWVDTKIATEASKIIHAIAFVIPTDAFAEASIRQVMMERNAMYVNIEFFDDLEQARQWLLTK